jgi:mannose-6-phosphate isomerase
MLEPFRLSVQFSERVWGRASLAPWYDHSSAAPIGEAWLTGEMCPIETGPHAGKLLGQLEEEFGARLNGAGRPHFPLLVKLLFPQEKLSVQVHPNDEDAAALGDDVQAKTECWYVLSADPGATVALGLRPGTTDAQVDAALGNAAFEDLLEYVPVADGDMVYVEAGTVHAIGGGVTLLEVQQTSDTTYRLYDYGRPRELHLEDGRKVIRIRTDAGKVPPSPIAHGQQLIAVPHFAVDRIELKEGDHFYIDAAQGPESIICLFGSGELLCGETRLPLAIGEAIIVPACQPEYSITGECTFIRTYVPLV